MASAALDFILYNSFDFPKEDWVKRDFQCAMIGLDKDDIIYTNFDLWNESVDFENRRPIHQWWIDLLEPFHTISQETGTHSPKL